MKKSAAAMGFDPKENVYTRLGVKNRDQLPRDLDVLERIVAISRGPRRAGRSFTPISSTWSTCNARQDES